MREEGWEGGGERDKRGGDEREGERAILDGREYKYRERGDRTEKGAKESEANSEAGVMAKVRVTATLRISVSARINVRVSGRYLRVASWP